LCIQHAATKKEHYQYQSPFHHFTIYLFLANLSLGDKHLLKLAEMMKLKEVGSNKAKPTSLFL
jgi:hypothetical protein